MQLEAQLDCADRAMTGPVVRTFRGLEGLDEVTDAWGVLIRDAGSPTQHPTWVRACIETFGTGAGFQATVVGPARQVTALAPLLRRRNGLGYLEMPGVAELGEPSDLIYADPSALASLARALAGLGCAVYLRRVPVDSPTLAALRDAYRGRGVVIGRPADAFPAIALDATWEEPERQFNAGRRSDLRRARRNAERAGPVGCEVLSPSPAELGPLLDEAFQVEAAGWKGLRGSAMALSPTRGPFFRRYAAAAAREGILRLCFLRIGGRAAAMQLAVECGGRFWLLKIGYDEEFSRCSPGVLLMLHTVRYAATRGLQSYEFLGRIEPWTRVWARIERPCVSIRAYPASTLGLAQLGVVAAGFAWRKLVKVVRGQR